jgi:mRNA-degrading endonuclease RelE of RelBE toxin-antitoxin system
MVENVRPKYHLLGALLGVTVYPAKRLALVLPPTCRSNSAAAASTAAQSVRRKRMFEINFTDGAIEDLEVLSELEQKQVVAAIESHLSLDAAQESDDRKRLHPRGLAEWEVRFGYVRVFYDVDYESSTVKIESIGRTFFHEKVKPFRKRAKSSKANRVPIADFDEEIKLTRSTPDLIALLKERALQPATVSLQNLKKQLGLESTSFPS